MLARSIKSPLYSTFFIQKMMMLSKLELRYCNKTPSKWPPNLHESTVGDIFSLMQSTWHFCYCHVALSKRENSTGNVCAYQFKGRCLIQQIGDANDVCAHEFTFSQQLQHVVLSTTAHTLVCLHPCLKHKFQNN